MRYEHRRYVSAIPVFICTLALAGVAFTFSAQAQRRATISTTPVRAQQSPAVPVIKVTAADKEAASGLPTGKRQHKPLAIATAEKVKLLQPQGGANLGSGADVPISSVKLSPRKTFVLNRAMLSFNHPSYVSTTSDHAVFSKLSGGYIGVAVLHFKVAKGERYLVDYSVAPYRAGNVNYTVKFADGTQQFSGSEPKHLLFVLEAQASGWAWLELGAAQEFNFYSVEASKMD